MESWIENPRFRIHSRLLSVVPVLLFGTITPYEYSIVVDHMIVPVQIPGPAPGK